MKNIQLTPPIQNIQLTQRDFRILKFIKRRDFVRRVSLMRFFPSRDALGIRLRALLKAELLKSDTITNPGNLREEEILSIGSRLKNHIPYSEVNSHPFWLHQIELSDYWDFLEKALPDSFQYKTEAELKSENPRCQLYPDLEVTGHQNGLFFKIAIELERSLKRSNKRYFNKWSYLSTQAYTHVIYHFLGDPKKLDYLIRLAKNWPNIFFSQKKAPGYLRSFGRNSRRSPFSLEQLFDPATPDFQQERFHEFF